MVKTTKYGIISDIHQDPSIIEPTVEILKDEGIDKLILNGDIGNHQKTMEQAQGFIAVILDKVGRSGLETYVQPGSHETLGQYVPVLNHMQDIHSNIVDIIADGIHYEFDDHNLLFLPGSDFRAGGEFALGNEDKIPTAMYIETDRGLTTFTDEKMKALIQKGEANGIMHYQNMKDLETELKDPDKTIVVCHIPSRFDSVDDCVDMAYFAKMPDGGIVPGNSMEWQIRNAIGQDASHDEVVAEAKRNSIDLLTEDRGNEDLRDLYEKNGITKGVSGHFHESGHRANDSKSKPVKEGKLVDELFWNSGHLDVGQTGILTVTDGKVSYRNINLKDYIKQ